MKKKIFAISCVTLFLLIGLPNIQAQETIETPIFNNMPMAHVTVKGSGTEFIMAGNFILGFGKCGFIRITLEDDGHVEINKFLDSSNVTVLDGSHVVTLFGFFGYYRHAAEINLVGVALLAFWK